MAKLPFKRALQLFVFSFVLSNAGQGYASSIESAVQSAFASHPSVESATAALNAVKEQKNEAFSGYFPEISLSATGGRIFGDNSTSRGLSVTRGSAYSYLGEGSASVSQLLFDGLETPRRVDAAETRKMSAGIDIVDVRESLALRAVESYINVVRARKGLELLDQHGKKIDDYLGRIRNMVNEGASDETELQQARDIQVILEGIKADFEGQVISAESQYAEVVGSFPQRGMSEPTERSSFVAADVTKAVAIAKESHPSLLSAQLQSKAASYDVDAEKGTLYPDVNAELSYLKSDKDDVIGGEAIDARAVVRMNWNFSTGGEQLARIRRTKFTHQESLARTKELKRQIERDVRLAYSEYQTSGKQLELLKERQALNAKLFSAYESQFEGARVNLLQLMQAHNQLFNTNLEMMNGKYRHIASQYGVLASTGRLQNALNLSAAQPHDALSHDKMSQKHERK